MTDIRKDTRLLHGGDYNPDQWLQYPQILEEDLQLMSQAKVNTVSLGIFAWAALEPEEGHYDFGWLDERMDKIAQMGGNVILATPSGARPAWMSQKYPEVLRTNERREKMEHGGRHNHCFSSPIYREKVAQINRLLAQRYKDHPSLAMWHISNEYSGECHCPHCQAAFRSWLKKKYQTLDALNHAWWGPFWSHTITDWEQIQSPSPIGEMAVHGLNLDWRRFVTDQTIDFYLHECQPLREITPHIPITTNFMADTYDLIPFQALDYGKFSQVVDLVSWDCYPAWHNDWESTAHLASKVAFINDQYRSLKQQPFLIMESTPSAVNWHGVNKSKRPGMHLLSSMQLLAHGSDSILYFQWRKSRGSSEKFHGAVVDHDGSADNRVFQDVAQLGQILEQIKEIKGSKTQARVAMVYDWENKWALDDAQGFSQASKRYPQTLQDIYRVFWQADIAVDVLAKHQDLAGYDLVIAPMMYLMDQAMMDQWQAYVAGGGHLITTYLTGLVDQNDLAYLGGWPQSLQELFGLAVTEIDSYYPSQSNGVIWQDGSLSPTQDYQALLQLKGAQVLGTYQSDFYQGTPAVTVHSYGQGKAYFVGPRFDTTHWEGFLAPIMESLGLANDFVLEGHPEVSVVKRQSDQADYFFVLNFSEEKRAIQTASPAFDLIGQEQVGTSLELAPYQVALLKLDRKS